MHTAAILSSPSSSASTTSRIVSPPGSPVILAERKEEKEQKFEITEYPYYRVALAIIDTYRRAYRLPLMAKNSDLEAKNTCIDHYKQMITLHIDILSMITDDAKSWEKIIHSVFAAMLQQVHVINISNNKGKGIVGLVRSGVNTVSYYIGYKTTPQNFWLHVLKGIYDYLIHTLYRPTELKPPGSLAEKLENDKIETKKRIKGLDALVRDKEESKDKLDGYESTRKNLLLDLAKLGDADSISKLKKGYDGLPAYPELLPDFTESIPGFNKPDIPFYCDISQKYHENGFFALIKEYDHGGYSEASFTDFKANVDTVRFTKLPQLEGFTTVIVPPESHEEKKQREELNRAREREEKRQVEELAAKKLAADQARIEEEKARKAADEKKGIVSSAPIIPPPIAETTSTSDASAVGAVGVLSSTSVPLTSTTSVMSTLSSRSTASVASTLSSTPATVGTIAATALPEPDEKIENYVARTGGKKGKQGKKPAGIATSSLLKATPASAIAPSSASSLTSNTSS